MSTIRNLELHSQRIQLLTLIVVLGGIGRLLGFFIIGLPSSSMKFALGMELLITPLLCIWQYSLAQRFTFANSLQHP